MSLNFMYITNDIDVALVAQKYGVDRVWIDLETIGKEERQKGLDSVKSRHQISDIIKIKPYITISEILVRVNRWYEGSVSEINAVVEAGADIIMLPYWRTVDEVQKFVNAVDGRCKTTLLLENKEAVDIVDEVLKLGGFDEIHIGLNDLHLSYGLDFMFELLANGTVEMLCKKFAEKQMPYGFGGIAKLGEGLLPAEKIIMEHYRLGSTRVILSRTFCHYSKISRIDEIDRVFGENMKKLREYERLLNGMTKEEFIANRAAVISSVARIVEQMKKTRKHRI